MPGRKQPPEYAEARRSLSKHMFRHHGGVTGEGMLSNRLDQHEELHVAAILSDRDLGHTHEPCEDETEIDLAFRLLKEGDRQHGQANASGDA